jgi:glycerol-3-phosphate dehydrogenase
MAFGGKKIKVGLANFRDFHSRNYRIGTGLGQTLNDALDDSLTITKLFKKALGMTATKVIKETRFEYSQ